MNIKQGFTKVTLTGKMTKEIMNKKGKEKETSEEGYR